jgi:hypothetical protein
MDERETLLRRDGALIGIATAGLVNGSHLSPWFDVMSAPIAAILSGFYISSPALLFYFASLCISVFTVMISGVPAAIYEQSRGQKDSDGASMLVWMGAAILLALPAFLRIVGAW